MSINEMSMITPGEVAKVLAERLKTLRLMQGFKRQTLAVRAGVTVSSLKRFETTGKASLELVLKLAFALGRLDEFAGILQPPPAQSLADIERQGVHKRPKRGKR